MGILRIFRGVVKTIEGVIEGDGEKIVKGVVKTATGVATTVAGTDEDGEEIDDNDD